MKSIRLCHVLSFVLSLTVVFFAGAEEPNGESVEPPVPDPLPPLVEEPGFQSIFDGKSFEGWKAADMSFWSIEDGAITAKITEAHPTKRNHYLVWQGGKIDDFELKLRHRIISSQDVNGGFQYRSEMFDGDIPDDCRGYQVDNNTGTPWLVRLYDEFGRHTLAWRGEKTVFDADGGKVTTKIDDADGPARFSLDKWHEYHLICRGPNLTLKVNGRVVAEVIDNDPKQQDFTGILALQLHSGPPMTVQFKDIRLKRLGGEGAAE
jgi:3-keto-disaccharide hydrolase